MVLPPVELKLSTVAVKYILFKGNRSSNNGHFQNMPTIQDRGDLIAKLVVMVYFFIAAMKDCVCEIYQEVDTTTSRLGSSGRSA